MNSTLILLCATTIAFAQPKVPDTTLRRDAETLGSLLSDLAFRIEQQYVGKVAAGELLADAMEELYASIDQQLPANHKQRLIQSTSQWQAAQLIADFRTELGQHEPIRGLRALLIASRGFNKKTDPYGGLVWQRTGSLASVDTDYNLGFELEGVTGTRWVEYMVSTQLENAGRIRNLTNVPVGYPWTVKRVIPGLAAATAGIRPGDQILSLNDKVITIENSSSLFRQLVENHDQTVPRDNNSGPSPERSIQLLIRRPNQERSFAVTLRSNYQDAPTCIFGLDRRANGNWNYFFPADPEMAYLRISSLELGSDEAFREALLEIQKAKPKGLILDLRWCPGGYVIPTVNIAKYLLPTKNLITTLRYRSPAPAEPYFSDVDPEFDRLKRLPILVLVNQETAGGGEMIAAALQDNQRAVIAGQRTFGKANIMTLIHLPIPGLQYRVSTGFALRPNGVNRHRFVDSTAQDPWGVKPNPGFEIPCTPDHSQFLQKQIELHAIRPFSDPEAVLLDDPLEDSQRQVALRLLKTVLLDKRKQ